MTETSCCLLTWHCAVKCCQSCWLLSDLSCWSLLLTLGSGCSWIITNTSIVWIIEENWLYAFCITWVVIHFLICLLNMFPSMCLLAFVYLWHNCLWFANVRHMYFMYIGLLYQAVYAGDLLSLIPHQLCIFAYHQLELSVKADKEPILCIMVVCCLFCWWCGNGGIMCLSFPLLCTTCSCL